ncbi:MAG: hypothetical protein M1828_002673 [Chrysothrix sp. TS-e1954]|nr:MAG: hypothetical protein M1828_002673 [Chrysothrix sp. TS-e1954]
MASCLHIQPDREDPFLTVDSLAGTGHLQLSRPPTALTPTPSFSLAHQHTISRPHPSPLTSHPITSTTLTTLTKAPPCDRPASAASSHHTSKSTSTYFTTTQQPTPPRTPTKRVTFPVTPSAPKHDRIRSPGKKLATGLPSLNFGDLFTLQGSSAPVGFGVLPSPNREVPTHAIPLSGRSSPVKGIEGLRSSMADGTKRPKHTRSGSTLQVAASFLGLGGAKKEDNLTKKRERGRALQKLEAVPTKSEMCEEEEDDDDDEWLNLDIDKALFTGEAPIPTGFRDEAYEALAANARQLFSRMQAAYLDKHESEISAQDELDDALDAKDAIEEELDEARERITCLKEQLGEMGQQLADEVESTEMLKEELKEEKRTVRRIQSIRLVGEERQRGRSKDVENELVLMMEGEGEGQTMERLFSASDDVGDKTGGIGAMASRPLSASSVASSAVSTRPSTPRSAASTAPSSAPDCFSSPGTDGARPRASAMFWRDAAPFLKPEGGEGKLKKENDELKVRIRELEQTIEGCLGLVD